MLAAGTTLGPYRITAALGAGGMGEVYRAHDPRLGRDVALKVIRAGLAHDPDRIQRFQQEARAAGALDHPNVCTVFDVGEHDGAPFVVMELLEGGTLRERLAAGPLPVREALELVAQAAHGLAAAHEKGIVHRDLKPENLFVTRDGRVKLLDFGLAKLTRPDALAPAGGAPDSTAPTASGAIVGTAGYMAPEQVRGQAADARADLFALGAILYEALAGTRAFHGASAVETLHAILAEEPAPLPASGRELPRGLDSIVRRCLEKRPEERFQSARDLAFALESAGGASAAGARAARAPRRGRPRLAAFGLSALLAAAVAASFLAWRARVGGPAGELRPERIVVAVFDNQTGERSLDPLGRMTSDWITQGLSEVEGLEVVPSTSVLYAQPAGVRTRGDPVGALARETRAGTVVSGEYYLQGDTLRFQARVTDTVHDRVLRALDPVSGPRAVPLGSIDQLRQRVMGAVASHRDVSDLTLEQPPRYDAYLEFIAGFEIFVVRPEEALRHFDRAVELDSTFVWPMFFIAYLCDGMGDHARGEAVLRILDSNRERLTPVGRHWLDAMVAYTTHRYAEALHQLRVASQSGPRDPMIVLWIGYLSRLADRPEDTVEAFDRFGATPYPGHPLGRIWVVNLCDALHMLGRYPRELVEARRGLQRDPTASVLRIREAAALAAMGRVDELERAIDRSIELTADATRSGELMWVAAGELRAHGHRTASVAVSARAVEWHLRRVAEEPGEPDWRIGLVDALRSAERWPEAYDSCRALAERSPRDPELLGEQACLAARLGRSEEARRIAAELQAMRGPYLFGEPIFQRARVAAQLGDKPAAVALLREAFTEGVPYSSRFRRDIDLELLRGYPPFEELMRPRR